MSSQSWSRLTLYVALIGARAQDEREVRAVVITSQRTVLWADSTRGSGSELDEWVNERLISGVLPGSPRLHQLGPFKQIQACGCGRPQFPIGPTRLVCPSCDRDEQATTYAASMARRVQADYVDDVPSRILTEPAPPAEVTREAELEMPSRIKAGFLIARGTLRDATLLVREASTKTDQQAQTKRTTAYSLAYQLGQWLSAPADSWSQAYEEADSPQVAGALPDWEAFERLPLAEQQARLTTLLETVAHVIQAWERDPEQPPSPVEVSEEPVVTGGAPVATASDPMMPVIQKAVCAIVLALGVSLAAPADAAGPLPTQAVIEEAVNVVAMQQLPALSVIGLSDEFERTVEGLLKERGVTIVHGMQHKVDPKTKGSLLIEQARGSGYRLTLKNPYGRILLSATLDADGTTITVTESPTRPTTSLDPSLFAVTVEQALDRWVEGVVKALPPTTQQTVAFEGVRWPEVTIGTSRLTNDHDVYQAFAARLKRAGYTVVQQWRPGLPVIKGGLWDTSFGSEALLWLMEASGRIREISAVPFPVSGWTKPALGAPEAVLVEWRETLKKTIVQMAADLKTSGTKELFLPLEITDLDDQEIPLQSHTMRFLAWPLLIRACQDAGLQASVPVMPRKQAGQLMMRVDWKRATAAGGRSIVDGAAVTFEIANRGAWTSQLRGSAYAEPMRTLADLRPIGLGWPTQESFRDRPAFTETLESIRAGSRTDAAARDAWAKEQQHVFERDSASSVTRGLKILRTEHDRAAKDLEKTWAQSPSQEVPQNIQRGKERLRELRQNIPGADSLDWLEQQLQEIQSLNDKKGS